MTPTPHGSCSGKTEPRPRSAESGQGVDKKGFVPLSEMHKVITVCRDRPDDLRWSCQARRQRPCHNPIGPRPAACRRNRNC